MRRVIFEWIDMNTAKTSNPRLTLPYSLPPPLPLYNYVRTLCRGCAQVVMSQGGTIEYFQTAVFNFPTLAEAYNVAAADGLRKVDHELGKY